MTGDKHSLGRWGEEIGCNYLAERGYVILKRNLRTPHGEIDILASKENILVFIEVKTRSSNRFGFPETAVSPRKQAHMLRAAEAYFDNHPDAPETWQFDVLAITSEPGCPPQIEHFENIIG